MTTKITTITKHTKKKPNGVRDLRAFVIVVLIDAG
jgi:hypothetical protein